MSVLRLAAVLAACAPLAAGSPQGDEGAWRFVVLGHPRGGPGNGDIPHERLADAIAEINALDPDFVLLAGDLIYGDIHAPTADRDVVEADWDAVLNALGAFEAPWHLIPGNHDVWDATTRDVWKERFGPLFRSFTHKGTRIVMLCSPWVPKNDSGVAPGYAIRGVPLSDEQIGFLETEMAAASGDEHVFVVLHHLLWWEADSPWWTDVHPLLAGSRTRAVIAGDLGPAKFSHERRDGIDYVQTSVEFTFPPLQMRRNREGSRTISEQLDNFLLVTVDGADVRLEVRTLGAFTTGRYTPTIWQEVHDYDKGSFQRKLYKRMNTPERVVKWLAIGMGASFAAGLVVAGALGWALGRRRRA